MGGILQLPSRGMREETELRAFLQLAERGSALPSTDLQFLLQGKVVFGFCFLPPCILGVPWVFPQKCSVNVRSPELSSWGQEGTEWVGSREVWQGLVGRKAPVRLVLLTVPLTVNPQLLAVSTAPCIYCHMNTDSWPACASSMTKEVIPRRVTVML